MFSDELLFVIGSWQRGWREQQELRKNLAVELVAAVEKLPLIYRSVSQPCFRKRFLFPSELIDLILKDYLDEEGPVSWTLNREFAEKFKGLHREGAVTAAIFKYVPNPAEVILNIPALWQSHQFVQAFESYVARGGPNSEALRLFSDSQGEVILKAPIRASQIIALSGASSSFEELCDKASISHEARDEIYASLISMGVYPGELGYVKDDAAQRVISRTITKIRRRILENMNYNEPGNGLYR